MPELIELDPENDIVAVRGVLTPEECAARLARAERRGFGHAPITTAFGFVMAPEVRNNTRAMFDDPDEAAWLWERVRAFVPEKRRGGWQVIGLNERLRFYRYEVGQRFAWHRDGAYIRPNGEASKLTLMIYLDGGCLGGATEFFDAGELAVKPEPGKMLLFPHSLRHQGAPVRAGHKHVLRTDVMYRYVG